MKKLFAIILLLFLGACTVSQTQSGSGTVANKPTESTTTTNNTQS